VRTTLIAVLVFSLLLTAAAYGLTQEQIVQPPDGVMQESEMPCSPGHLSAWSACPIELEGCAAKPRVTELPAICAGVSASGDRACIAAAPGC
jgi:hypothetical protein